MHGSMFSNPRAENRITPGAPRPEESYHGLRVPSLTISFKATDETVVLRVTLCVDFRFSPRARNLARTVASGLMVEHVAPPFVSLQFVLCSGIAEIRSRAG